MKKVISVLTGLVIGVSSLSLSASATSGSTSSEENTTGSNIATIRYNAWYETAVKKALSGVKPEWSDFEKAYYLHNYIADNCDYAYDTDTGILNTAYDTLVNGKSKCLGYSDAYKDLLNRVGVACEVVISEKLCHAWNVVRIDGAWYYVDVTWDDNDITNYDCFLLSEEEFKKSHDADDYELESNDSNMNLSEVYNTFYDSGKYFQNGVINIDGEWYGVDGDKISIFRGSNDGFIPEKAVKQISADWSYKSEEYWGSFARLQYSNKKLYYSTPTKIIEWDMQQNNERVVFDLLKDTDYGSIGRIYGFSLVGNKVNLDIRKAPDSDALYLDYTIHKHTMGSWICIQKENCSVNGIYERKCNKCDLYEQKHVKATGKHKYSKIYKSGSKYYKKCSVCNKSIAIGVSAKMKALIKSLGGIQFTLKADKNSVVVTHTKNNNASGYEIEWDNNTKYRDKVLYRINSKNSTKTRLKYLNKNERCCVRIRAYRRVGDKIYYGSWSKSKVTRAK